MFLIILFSDLFYFQAQGAQRRRFMELLFSSWGYWVLSFWLVWSPLVSTVSLRHIQNKVRLNSVFILASFSWSALVLPVALVYSTQIISSSLMPVHHSLYLTCSISLSQSKIVCCWIYSSILFHFIFYTTDLLSQPAPCHCEYALCSGCWI